MFVIGSSEFGSTYYTKKPIIEGDKLNFQLCCESRNFNPENVAYGLLLLSNSIKNVIGFLKILNGVNPNECGFLAPSDKRDFLKPWEKRVGLNHCSFSMNIQVEKKFLFSKKDVINFYVSKMSESSEGKIDKTSLV